MEKKKTSLKKERKEKDEVFGSPQVLTLLGGKKGKRRGEKRGALCQQGPEAIKKKEEWGGSEGRDRLFESVVVTRKKKKLGEKRGQGGRAFARARGGGTKEPLVQPLTSVPAVRGGSEGKGKREGGGEGNMISLPLRA